MMERNYVFVLESRRVSLKPVKTRNTDTVKDILKSLNCDPAIHHCIYRVPPIALWGGAIDPVKEHYDIIPLNTVFSTIDANIVIYVTIRRCESANDVIIIDDSDEDDNHLVSKSTRVRRNNNISIVLTEEDMSTLSPGQWLNDQIINGYMELLMSNFKGKVCIVSTFFYTKLKSHGFIHIKKWIKRIKIMDYDNILIPINLSNAHWTIAHIDRHNKIIYHYDSLGIKRKTVVQRIQNLFSKLLKYKDWKINHILSPRQTNTYDCGVYICQYAYLVCKDLDNHSHSAGSLLEKKKRKLIQRSSVTTRQTMALQLRHQSLNITNWTS